MIAVLKPFVARPTLALLALGLLVSSTCAITTNWTNNSGGSFTTVANWDGGVPDDADIAVFDRGSGVTYTVTFPMVLGHSGDIVNDRLVVGSNTVTFNPTGLLPADYLLDNATTIEAHAILGTPVRGITIGADSGDTAAVLVSHLALLQTVAATLGHATGSSGTLTLDQSNDLFNVTGASTTDAELIVGRLGTGMLNVSGGADVTVNGITGGMFPLPAGNVILGRGATGQGTANISGSGSTLDVVASMVVGESGTGVLNITNSGYVETLTGTLGNLASSTGTATISGSGSRWRLLTLYVGSAGTGTLNVFDGGMVEFTNASGFVNVGGLGTFNLHSGTVGGDVDNAGLVHVTGAATLTGSLDNTADVLIDWAEPVGAVGLNVGGNVTNSGTIDVMIDWAEPVGATAIQVGGNVTNDGTVDMTIDWAEPVNAKVLDVGGSFTNNGTFDLTIDWAEPVGVVALDVAGGVTNNGTLNLTSTAAQELRIQLGPGQTLINNASGIVNLDGPDAVAKHAITGNVVNHGDINIRASAKIDGALTISSGGNVSIEGTEFCLCMMTVEVTGLITNAGTFTMRNGLPVATLTDGGSGSADHRDIILDARGGFTNDGTFNMANDFEEHMSVLLPANQAFTNSSTGVVNLEGPGDLNADNLISTLHTINADVVNHGQLNLRTNTQITGSLDNAVNANMLIDLAEPVGVVGVDVQGALTNSGTIDVMIDQAEPVGATGLVHADSISNSGSFHVTVHHAEPVGSPAIQVDQLVTNSGEFTLTVNYAEPVNSPTMAVGSGISNSGTFKLDSDSDLGAIVEVGGGSSGSGDDEFTNNETGVVEGKGTIDGTVRNRGEIRPGNSPGVLTVTGDYIQESGGKIVVDVAGTTAGSEYDQLAIGGAIELDGLVEVVFAEGFAPAIGNRFEIITTSEPVNGIFIGAALPGLPEGMDWNILYGTNLVTLAITVPGDYNGDGFVNAADYVTWRDTLGATPPAGTGADGDLSGTVDQGDYDEWVANFGATGGSAASPSAVPEPASAIIIVLCAIVLIILLTRRRKDA